MSEQGQSTTSDQTQTEAPANTEAQNDTLVVNPVQIGDVVVTEAITAAHVLKSQGIVEVVLPDGTRQQFSIAQAKERITQLKGFAEALGEEALADL